MVYPILKVTVLPLVSNWIKKINGLENVPKNGPFIIAANHSSYMDHMVIGAVLLPYLNKKIHFLAKKEHFDGIAQKSWHSYVAAIPVDREKGGDEALQQAVKALKQEKIIAIYPEGTRSMNGKIQKAKTGIARLALLSKAPVVPVGLVGTFDILPKGKYVPKFKRAIINFGKPLYFEEYANKKINKQIINKVTVSIMKEIARLSNQKYNFKHD